MFVNYIPFKPKLYYRYLTVDFVDVPLALLADMNFLHSVILLVFRPHMLREFFKGL